MNEGFVSFPTKKGRVFFFFSACKWLSLDRERPDFVQNTSQYTTLKLEPRWVGTALKEGVKRNHEKKYDFPSQCAEILLPDLRA